MPKGWKVLGAGSYNTAYVSDDGKSVLKIQKGDAATDTPERSVRLWNSINPHIPPPARLENTDTGVGWVCPFIKGVQASDKEMSGALIDIYNNTGRIIVDATAPKNFVKTPPPDSQVLCVDVGMALQMERREESLFTESIRRKSVVSLDTWRSLSGAYEPFFKQCQVTHPETVQTVKALVFIKNNRPDIFDVSFLKANPDLIKKLANAYDRQDPKGALAHLDKVTPEGVIVNEQTKPPVKGKTPEEIRIGKEILKEQRPINLENIKESCKVELQRYIDSRGSINKVTNTFEPSFMTRWFRNENLTRVKVEAVRDLMSKIDTASSLDEISAALKEKSTPELFSATYTQGLSTAIAKCSVISEMAKNDPNLQSQIQSALNQ
jgi:hypothetical protein